MSHTRQDLSGKTFGSLAVLRRVQNRLGALAPRYLCRCVCGKEVEYENFVRNGNPSCGCQRKAYEHPKRKEFGYSSLNWLCAFYRNQAKTRGLTFELSKQSTIDIFRRNCHYCDAAPSQKFQRKGGYGFCLYNGIDRVDNTLGYVPGNVVPCCRDCNYAKGTMTSEAFLGWVRRVANYQGWLA